jgi:hypothetical protein
VYGPVPLALGRPIHRQAYWVGVREEPPEVKTGEEYGRRVDSEEHCFDETSNGFQLEASLIRSANAFARLGGVLAITTRYLVIQGTEVVTQGKRRWVDAHGFRGQSSLQIGWNWVQRARSQGYALVTILHLSPHANPFPAMASKIQPHTHPELCLALECPGAVA